MGPTTILLAPAKGLDRTICQGVRNLPTEQKPHTHNKNPTLQNHRPRKCTPFHADSLDLVTGLPKSWGFDAILTIVDHGSSQGTIFLPCNATITGPQIAQLYYKYVYPWFCLPNKVISDRDPRFTSQFGRALAKELGITWNMSTMYHPQTDRLMECKNQWIEQYLRLVAGNDKEWSNMLPIATLVHNNSGNSTTRLMPNQLLIGGEPPTTLAQGEGTDNPLAEQRARQLGE
jgi:hypothetical protein